MNKTLLDMEKEIGPQHHDVYKFALHLREKVFKEQEERERINGVLATDGERINGEIERVIREQRAKFLQMIIQTMEETVEDYQHRIDKNDKHFKDGID